MNTGVLAPPTRTDNTHACTLAHIHAGTYTKHAHARMSARTQHNTTQQDTTRHNTTQHDTTRHDTTRHDTTRHDTTQHTQQHTHTTRTHLPRLRCTSTRSRATQPTAVARARRVSWPRPAKSSDTSDVHVDFFGLCLFACNVLMHNRKGCSLAAGAYA